MSVALISGCGADVARLGNAKHGQALLSRLEASDSADVRASPQPAREPKELGVSGSSEAPEDPGLNVRANQLRMWLDKLMIPVHPVLRGAISVHAQGDVKTHLPDLACFLQPPCGLMAADPVMTQPYAGSADPLLYNTSDTVSLQCWILRSPVRIWAVP